MDIVIVAQYCGDISDMSSINCRFTYLAEMLAECGHEVEVITTDFIHEIKEHVLPITEFNNVKYTMLHECGYPRNICLRRFKSHKELAKNVANYLNARKKPELLYAAVPSLDVADAAAAYCKKNGIKFVVDIQDLWPEAFKMIVNVPPFTNMIYSPLEKQANRIYSMADQVVAVSDTYVQRAMMVNQKCKNPMIVYLGTEMDYFDQHVTSKNKNDEKIKLAYCGTLGHSYDITIILNAMRKLTASELEKIEFVVMGDGPKKKDFEEAANGLPVNFVGRLPYGKMVECLTECDVAVNPIVPRAAQSIINKHMDYAMAGLPVINTQECIEYRRMVEEYQCGINCRCGNVEDVVAAIRKLLEDRTIREKMGKNARLMGEKLFDKKATYMKLVELITK